VERIQIHKQFGEMFGRHEPLVHEEHDARELLVGVVSTLVAVLSVVDGARRLGYSVETDDIMAIRNNPADIRRKKARVCYRRSVRNRVYATVGRLLSVCLFHRAAARYYCRFAAAGPAGKRCRLIAAAVACGERMRAVPRCQRA